jgi:hypothetical protein
MTAKKTTNHHDNENCIHVGLTVRLAGFDQTLIKLEQEVDGVVAVTQINGWLLTDRCLDYMRAAQVE